MVYLELLLRKGTGILPVHFPGKPTSNYCRLCLTEKIFIINSIGNNPVFDKRSEFINKCRHKISIWLKKLSWKIVWVKVENVQYEYL